MKIKQKIFGVLLLSLFLLPYFYFFSFHIQQQRLIHKMEERLETENLITLTVSSEEIQWVKYKKEIIVNGRMFDIKDVIFDDGYFIMQGLYDEDETKLVAQLREDLQHNSKKKHTNILLCWFQYNQNPVSNFYFIPYSSSLQNNFQFYKSGLSHISLSVLTPPPNHQFSIQI